MDILKSLRAEGARYFYEIYQRNLSRSPFGACHRCSDTKDNYKL